MTTRVYDEDNNGVNAVHLDGALWLTWCRPEEVEPDGSALLTVRGKDHSITAQEAREIAADLLRIADLIEGAS